MDLAAAMRVPKDHVKAQVYDALGCALIVSESVMATVAAVSAMESRFARRVATRVDLGVSMELATRRAAYKGPPKNSATGKDGV